MGANGFFLFHKSTSCGRGPSSELTPTASAASLGYAGLQAARRNTRFARYCEEYTLADALFSRRILIYSKQTEYLAFFYGCKKILGGGAEDFSITFYARVLAILGRRCPIKSGMTIPNYELLTPNYSTSLPWHFLYLRPEPHQQRSLRPSFAPACCWARFTAAARAALAAAERFGQVPGSALCGIGCAC